MKKFNFEKLNPFSDYYLDKAIAQEEKKLPLPNFTEDSKVIDIRNDNEWRELSWLVDNPFTFLGHNTMSISSFLNALKFKGKKQQKIFALSGIEAQKACKRNLYWLYFLKLHLDAKPIDRFNSVEYTLFLDMIFNAMAEQNVEFVKKLISTGNARLTSTELYDSRYFEPLCENEFIYILYGLRERYKNIKEDE